MDATLMLPCVGDTSGWAAADVVTGDGVLSFAEEW